MILNIIIVLLVMLNIYIILINILHSAKKEHFKFSPNNQVSKLEMKDGIGTFTIGNFQLLFGNTKPSQDQIKKELIEKCKITNAYYGVGKNCEETDFETLKKNYLENLSSSSNSKEIIFSLYTKFPFEKVYGACGTQNTESANSKDNVVIHHLDDDKLKLGGPYAFFLVWGKCRLS